MTIEVTPRATGSFRPEQNKEFNDYLEVDYDYPMLCL